MMFFVKRSVWLLLLTAVFALSACFALSEPEAASGPVAAPTLAVVEETAVPVEEPTTVPVEEDVVVAETAVPVEEPTTVPVEEEVAEEPTAVPVEEEVAEIQIPEGLAIFEMDGEQSEARFLIDEVLRGDPITVVGTTSDVAGQIAFDMANPATAQVGQIVINARTIATDNNFRNRAISNRILLTNDFEFIIFTPTQLVGVPESVIMGEAYDFQIVGDLTITDETREVTFDVTVTPMGNSLQGVATVTILYADFGLEIPFAQAVDSVEDEVILELTFLAPATGEVAAGG